MPSPGPFGTSLAHLARHGLVTLALLAGCHRRGLDEPPSAAPAAYLEPRAARARPSGADDLPRLALGARGAVASQERLATEVGLATLRRGGNAIDAAIAVGFALATTHAPAGNLGGGGFMLVQLADGRSVAFDFRETAPGAATRDMYLDPKGSPTKDSVEGPRAAGIPGTVSGFHLAHHRFGSLPWHTLVAPALALAEEHEVDAFEAKNLERGRAAMRAAGFEASAQVYERPDGSAFVAGDRWRQPELAATLREIAAEPAAFYQGALAKRLVDGVRAAGGLWTMGDLAGYRTIEREPTRFAYRGYDLVTMPLPSAGGIVLRQMLVGCESLEMSRFAWHSVDELHLYAEVARRAYADRNTLLGDPAFVDAPVAALTDEAYIRRRMSDVDLTHATPSSRVAPGLAPRAESHDTTHYSVIDERGNAVATTYTLNASFGAKFVVPGTGVLLNDEMDDFAVKPGAANLYGLVQGEPNAIAPGKRMLSSMTPTIVVKGGDVRAVLGSPGGPTITTTVVQLARALIDYGQPLDVAVAAPRLHHQWLPDAIVAERAMPTSLLDGLRARGHALELRERIGNANVIEVDPATRGFRAVADVARGGAAAAAY
ncbi:MAG: gamma-glutamyltransferase [Deltaproteobacteria bacterium]|nr:gamma-glutamyltransferase [Deltaproteobacteria bacterium]